MATQISGIWPLSTLSNAHESALALSFFMSPSFEAEEAIKRSSRLRLGRIEIKPVHPAN